MYAFERLALVTTTGSKTSFIQTSDTAEPAITTCPAANEWFMLGGTCPLPGSAGESKGGDEPMTAIVARWIPLAPVSTPVKDYLRCAITSTSAPAAAGAGGSMTTNHTS